MNLVVGRQLRKRERVTVAHTALYDCVNQVFVARVEQALCDDATGAADPGDLCSLRVGANCVSNACLTPMLIRLAVNF